MQTPQHLALPAPPPVVVALLLPEETAPETDGPLTPEPVTAAPSATPPAPTWHRVATFNSQFRQTMHNTFVTVLFPPTGEYFLYDSMKHVTSYSIMLLTNQVNR